MAEKQCHVLAEINGLAGPVEPPAVRVPGQQAALTVVAIHPAHVHGNLHHFRRRADVQLRLREESRGADRLGTVSQCHLAGGH